MSDRHTGSGAIKVVVFGIDVPRRNPLDAGGRYLASIRDDLQSRHVSTTFLAPRTYSREWREDDLGSDPNGQIIIGSRKTVLARVEELIRRVLWRTDPCAPDYRFRLALIFSPRVRRVVRSADVVDLQWTENGALIGQIARLNRRARIVISMHDVLVQKYERRLKANAGGEARLWRRALRRAEALTSKILDRADAVAVLSEKDAAMLPAGVAEVVVVPPVVHSPRADDQQTPRAAGDVIFVGAMRRPENNTAALWLIRDIWPLVRGRIETCRLLIVGSEPSDEVISAAAEMDDVIVTGRVDSVDDFYFRSAIAVVPLTMGAGVKFKTIDALLAGCTVVATDVGIEGIGRAEWFWTVADDTEGLAQGIISALERPTEAAALAEKARVQAADFYSERTRSQALDRIYGAARG